MAAIEENSLVNGLLAAIFASYYLSDKIMGPKVPLLSSLHILVPKVTKKKRALALPPRGGRGWWTLFLGF
jgi:hypothetical protein